jgi:hypothetical protein
MTASQVPQAPPGYVVITFRQLEELLAAGRTAPGTAPGPATATLEAMSGVIALITARLGERSAGLPPADQAALTEGVPDAALIRTFAVFAAATLAAIVPHDRLTGFLQDLGADVVKLTGPGSGKPP